MTTRHMAIEAQGLRKRFSHTDVLAGVDLAVPAGTVCGLLGPNGAGKTTLVRILTTLSRPDSGRATVAGLDVVTQAEEVRYRIGLVGQHAAVDEILSGRQNLVLFGRLLQLSGAAAQRRADELLARFGLADTGHQPVATFSGGMRRRLDLAASLILAPPVLFLDEPTTGLDPRGRAQVWADVRALVAAGTTVLLTTQYLAEADQLADQVCIIDAGRIIAAGAPEELKSALGGDRVDVVVRRAADLPVAVDALHRVTGADVAVDTDARRVSAPVQDRMSALSAVVHEIGRAQLAVEDVAVRRPTLDEVFLHLTGRRATPAPQDPGPTGQEVAA